MNTFLEGVKEFCLEILPLLGVIALIVVTIFILELTKTIKNANNVLTKTQGTVDLVDESIKKVQVPLDSVVKVSKTVDAAHDATIKGIGEAKEFVTKNANMIKEKIDELTGGGLKKEDVKEPSPDDIIGGE